MATTSNHFPNYLTADDTCPMDDFNESHDRLSHLQLREPKVKRSFKMNKNYQFHKVRKLQELKEMWINNQLCDVVLKVGDKKFPVHKIVLRMKSDYFRGYFDFIGPGITEIEVKDVSEEELEKLISYCYTDKYEINSENVQNTFIMADRLAFVGLLDMCTRYMIRYIDADNCLAVRNFARHYSCQKLLGAVQAYIWKNFRTIAEDSQDFVNIPFASLTSLLRSEELNVRSEEKAFEAIVRWINHDPVNRKAYILPLLESVRLGLIDINYFVEKIKTCPYVRDAQECRPLIRKTIRFLLNLRDISPSMDSSSTDNADNDKSKKNDVVKRRKSSHERRKRGMIPPHTFDVIRDELVSKEDKDRSIPVMGSRAIDGADLKHPFAQPRLPHEILFVIGGWSGGSPTNIVETYDTRADRWIRCPALEPREPRAYHGLVSFGGKIYMVGGFNGEDYFNTCKVLNPSAPVTASPSDGHGQDRAWTEVAPMNSPRCYVSVASLGDYIYAMGGFDGHARLNTAERYYSKTNQWTPIYPMNHQRSDASATSLRDRIYIVGGFNGQECMSSAEYYDPATNLWNAIQPMKVKRSGVGLVGLHGKLYALGGFNGISRMASGERYDPDSDTWEPLPEMNHPRSNFACEVVDDMVFVIGGFNGVSTIYHVECYNDTSNEWFEATDMNLYRSALSACVVSNLPNRDDFIHKNRQNLLEEKKTRIKQMLSQ